MDDDNPWGKSQTVDPGIRAYVQSLVNAIGGSSLHEYGQYTLGDDALACLRDLKRWLRMYDEKTNRLDVARCLAEAKIVTGDLLPILASWSETEGGKTEKLKARVALACLELLVPLTWPLETSGEMTVNHHRHIPYLQQAQVVYKAGILGWDTSTILRQVVRISLPSIAMPREERTPRDEGIIKLVLYLLRNVATIRQIPSLPTQGLESEVSRSATIDAFRGQDAFALMLTMCSNMGEDFNLQDVIILEIIFNIIKGVDPKRLWMTDTQRKGQEISDLKATLAAEENLTRDAKKNAWSRHGRFGTMIWVKRDNENVSAVSGQDNLRSGRNALFNMDKSKKWNRPQQRQKDLDHTIHDFSRKVVLSPSATEKLKNFTEEFLDSGFNPLFTHLRKAIEREADRLTDVNYRQFFYCVSWFLEAERIRRAKRKDEVRPANQVSEFDIDSYSLVAAVLNQETFIMLNRYMQVSADNKEWQDLTACMGCFTQILLTVQEMSASSLEEDQEIAENIQNRIFYEETTHDRIINLVKSYKDQGFGYLDACTELVHVFLRVLERYSKENVDLQIRSRRKAKRKKKEAAKAAEEAATTAAQQTSSSRSEPQDAENEDERDHDSENEDIADVIQVSKERKFDFNRLVTKFTSQGSVNTFVALTSFYRDLTSEQLKRAHRFFYRVAFKQDLAVLLYRVDIIALFHRMIEGPQGLASSNPMLKEWSEFSKQLFRKMFKKINQRPELIVEMLFSKINATLYYLEFGREKQTVATTRTPAELEVKSASGRGIEEQIGIVVTALIQDDKRALVKWVKDELENAYDKRSSWELEAEARKSDDATEGNLGTENPKSAKPIQHASIPIVPVGEEVRMAMFKNARLKLLMRLVSFEKVDHEDVLGAAWQLPGTVDTDTLKQFKEVIEQYENNLWQPREGDDTNTKAEDQLRRVRNSGKRTMNDDGGDEDDADGVDARRDAFIDDSEGDENPEEFLFPDNIRKKSGNKARNIIEELKARQRRKRKRNDDGSNNSEEETDEEELARKRKARKQAALERRRKIKSDLYIRDSDDESDVEKDRAFFEKEESLRERQGEKIKTQMALGVESGEKDKTRSKTASSTRGTKRRKTDGSDKDHVIDIDDEDGGTDSILNDMLGLHDSDDGSDGGNDEFITASSSPPSHRKSSEDNDDIEMEDTPLSSQDPGDINDRNLGLDKSAKVSRAKPNSRLKELAQPRTKVANSTVGSDSRNKGSSRLSGVEDRSISMSGRGSGNAQDDDDDNDDDDEPVQTSRSSRKPFRAGFLVESDDEE